MVELADTQDLKSCACNGREGSSPSSTIYKYSLIHGKKMSDYQNKKKFKKRKDKEKSARKKILAKRKETREEAKVQKIIDKIQYDNRERLTPLKKAVDSSPEE